MCGTPIGEGNPAENSLSVGGAISSSPMSTIKFAETKGKTSRELEAKITDALGVILSDAAITSIFTGQVPSEASTRLPSQSKSMHSDPRQLSLVDIPSPEGEGSVVVDVIAVSKAEKTDTIDRFKDIFRCRDGQVQLIESRLKASNKLDAARRLVYLFLLYSEGKEQEEVPRGDVTKILKQANLDDSNSRRWIRKSSDLINDNNEVGLRQSGRERAEQIFREVLDPSVQDKWSLDKNSASRKSSAKSDDATATAKSKNRNTGKASVDVEDWVRKWKPIAQDLSFHETLKSSSLAQKGCFGLWAIGKATKNPDVLVSRGKLKQFLHLGCGLKVDDRNLSRKLQEIEGKGDLIKVKGGFQLLNTGVTAIEESFKIQSTAAQEEELDLWQDHGEA